MYGVGGSIFGMPVATGTNTPKKPDYLKSKSAIHCPMCGSVWVSNPYSPDDDPDLHDLWCVNGWSSFFLVWTMPIWNKLFEIPDEDEA